MSKNSLAHLRKSSIYMMFCYDSDIELRKDNTTYQHIASFPVCPDNLEAEHDKNIRENQSQERKGAHRAPYRHHQLGEQQCKTYRTTYGCNDIKFITAER